MTTNPTPIQDPTSPTEVVVGKRNGETIMAVRADNDDIPWAMQYPDGGFQWCSWRQLCGGLTDIRVVDVPELAVQIDQLKAHIAALETAAIYAEGVHQGEMASQRDQLEARIAELGATKPERGPWLRGDELEAVMPTLKEGDVVEVESEGHTATGELWAYDRDYLSMGGFTVRCGDGSPGSYVDALRIIERAPEPEPEPIPDDVVEAAWSAFDASFGGMRDALAAADAKRAELEGGEQA